MVATMDRLLRETSAGEVPTPPADGGIAVQ
jgi:hypothetical protein